jgi:hypothetical protein
MTIRLVRVLALALALVAGGRLAPAQTLSTEGGRFTIDGRPQFLIFVSYFDGLRRANTKQPGGGVDGDFAYFKRIGVDGIRVLPNWHYLCGAGPSDDRQKLFTSAGAINEPMWPVFLGMLDRAAFHGLSVDVTFTRDTFPRQIPLAAYRTAIVEIAKRLREAGGYRHVLFDIQNEYPIHGMTGADVHGVLSAVRDVDPERIVTASAGSGDVVHDPAMTITAYHDGRDSGWSEGATARAEIEAVRARAGPAVKPIYYQEPMPFRKFRTDCGHGEWPRPGHARLAARHARQHGAAAWTFHTRQSFDLRERSLLQLLEADPEQKAELEAVAAVE